MRLLKDVQALEVLPEGMRGIGDAAVQQRIGEQQVTEFVGDDRDGDRQQRSESQAQRDHARDQSDR